MDGKEWLIAIICSPLIFILLTLLYFIIAGSLAIGFIVFYLGPAALSTLAIPITFLVVGIFVLIVWIIMVSHKWEHLMVMKVVFIALSFCALLACAIGGVVEVNKLQGQVDTRLSKLIAEYTATSSSQLDATQNKFQCCGVNSSHDYGDKSLPNSCLSSTNVPHAKGCLWPVINFLRPQFIAMYALAFISAAIVLTYTILLILYLVMSGDGNE